MWSEHISPVGNLLIEPVWNRNRHFEVVWVKFFQPFNRTSLESELNVGALLIKFTRLFF